MKKQPRKTKKKASTARPAALGVLIPGLSGAVSTTFLLRKEDRILLTLKEVEGLSLKELEKVYQVNENALKVRLFRARQRV